MYTHFVVAILFTLIGIVTTDRAFASAFCWTAMVNIVAGVGWLLQSDNSK
jgi:hypothetical protein